jgi:hypothetical protein
MKKIVIVTNRSEADHALLASLNILFPECEVQVVFKKGETVAQHPASCSLDRLMAHADIEI